VGKKLTIGLSLSLSGPYAAMGLEAERALRLFAAECNAAGGIQADGEHLEIAIECLDDKGSRARTKAIYQELCSSRRVNLLFSPYGSGLARAAAPIADNAGMVFVNHGGADDQLYLRDYRTIVGVLTPASEYMTEVVRLVSSLKFWRKRVAIVSAEAPFASAVADGAERACAHRQARRRGVRIRVKYRGRFDPERSGERFRRALRRNRVNVLLSAGSYEHDVSVMRFATSERLYLPVLCCIAAGVKRFQRDLGDDAEGIVAPTQWDAGVDIRPTLGPSSAEFVRRFRACSGAEPDYPAVQAYAAGLLTAAAVSAAGSMEPAQVRAAFSDVRATTLFGDFAIDRTSGRQVAHKMALVQWHEGRKVIIQPEPDLGMGELEFPSGWRLLLASLQMLRLRRRERPAEDGNEEN